MKIVSRDEIIAEKITRRNTIKELECHANGDCIHLGKISPGCETCFIRNSFSSYAVYTGCECNASCGYCYYEKNRNDQNWNTSDKIRNCLADLYAFIMHPDTDLKKVTYNSWGETLMYPAILKESSNLIKRWEKDNNKKVYNHLYTNGLLADEEMLSFLKNCGIIELRFHPSASMFSNKVLRHMKLAVEMGFVVTVEEPSLPENKEKIIQHHPVFNEIGVKHLDLVECQVTSNNREYLEKKYPNGRIYRDFLWHLYDEGMVYDIMEEVIKNKYTFSVIDCNSRVECCRDTHQITRVPELVDWNMMEGACSS